MSRNLTAALALLTSASVWKWKEQESNLWDYGNQEEGRCVCGLEDDLVSGNLLTTRKKHDVFSANANANANARGLKLHRHTFTMTF